MRREWRRSSAGSHGLWSLSGRESVPGEYHVQILDATDAWLWVHGPDEGVALPNVLIALRTMVRDRGTPDGHPIYAALTSLLPAPPEPEVHGVLGVLVHRHDCSRARLIDWLRTRAPLPRGHRRAPARAPELHP
jgi:hypothetical protein